MNIKIAEIRGKKDVVDYKIYGQVHYKQEECFFVRYRIN